MRQKIAGLALFAPLALGVVLGPLVATKWTQVEDKVGTGVTQIVENAMTQNARDLWALAESAELSAQRQVDTNVKLAKALIESGGGLRAAKETAEWSVDGQKMQLPRMVLGNTWLGQSRSFSERAPLVDTVTATASGTCTVFQRINAQGDMLRVATTLKTPDGNRALGVPLYARDATPTISAILSKQSFRGRSFLDGAWHAVAYEPLVGADGEVLGMVGVGVPCDAKGLVRAALQRVKVGTTGYVFVLGGKGALRGNYILSKDAKRDGENIWEAKDASGRPFVQGMVEQALSNKPGEATTYRYPWTNEAGKPPVEKIAAIAYFEPWDWVIGVSGEIADVEPISAQIKAEMGATARLVGGLALFLVLAIAGVGLWVGKRLSQPVVEMCRVADRLAEGDIAQEITHHGGDELGRLADSFRHMVEVQQGRVHLAEQIAAGDLSGKVVVTTDKDTLGRAMQHMQERIGALVKDVRTLGTEAVAGHLAFRADPRPHQGEYRNIVEGINDTLDAVIGPLDVAAEYVERISRGDIPDPITDEYRGDFAEIRNNLNRCIEAVRLLVSDARGLAGAAVEGRLATRVDAARHQGDFRRVIEGVNETLDAVIGPLNVAAEYVERIARGDIPAKITEAYRGDFAEIRNNLNRCIDAVNLLVADADTLAAGAQEGRLSVRADASRHGGDFQRVIEGVNRTLDCVIGPLDEAAGCIARIAAGDLPPKISSDFKGDFRALKDNLNRCIDTIHALVADATMLAEAAVNGDLDKRADATRHQGDFKRIIDGVNGSLDALVGPLSRAIAHLEHLAAGQVDEEITREEKGDYVRLKDSFNQTFRSIRALIADARKLSEGAVAGKLATRADASAHRGDFRKIIEGVNATLDAVIGPLNVAAEYVERISRGDLPQKITEAYAGDFNEIRNNLNTCIDAITALVTDARMLAAAATEGRLGSRADATRHGGDFRRVIEGVNTTLDALTGPLKASAECLARIARGDVPDPITAEYRGEFNAIKDSLNTCIHTIDALVEDTTGLAASAVAGDLSKRGDASRHQGDFKRIVQGVNGALDALVDPLSRSITHLEHLAAGQVDEEITREEKGDYVRLKDSFNQTFRAINALIEDANQLAAAAVEGRLSSRADVSRHRGDFKRIIEGFNGTLDAVIGPLSSAADCVSKIAAGAIPPRLDTAARGEYESLRQNLNGCIAAVGALVADANLLSEAALAGRLAVRADASRHHGDFKRIVDGFNGTLDAVMGPVNAATSVLQRLADQDLRARVNGEFQGDHARLKEVVNTTAQSLHDALSTVAQTVEQVASAAEQIASTSQSVAQGSSEQAAALEETSGNLEEMSGRTKQSAENTQQAHALARTTKSVADQGALAMGRMGEAMGRIRHGAEGTAEIIRDINEIAFQTNLLALNAAVEAARAGDAGRGFAVVAEEVRSLAQRAKEAAKRTEDLIRESVKLASEGEALSHEVAGNLGEIVSNVGKVTAVVQEIAAASQEQSKGIEQINKALVQMDKVTQQAAGNAEESSSAAAELSTQSQSLAALVGRFQLERAHEAGLAGALPRVRLPGLRSTNGNGNGHFAHGNGHLVGGNGHATPLLPADSPREERPKV